MQESKDPEVTIKGLHLVEKVINLQEQDLMIKDILKGTWNTSLKRRTQHFGYEYNYDRKSQVNKAQPIPEWCEKIKKRIQQIVSDRCGTKLNFDQLIVNQYEPGQGINPHIDNLKLFNNIIVSLSLGSDIIMNFEKGQQKKEVWLHRRSLLIIEDEARNEWKHSIPSRKSDYKKIRQVRYSLTFRQMKLADK